jgi:predicted nucleic acid-binding protein
MKVALDTSVLVAALWMEHREHRVARSWVLPAENPDLSRMICAHALAETWSVLTRLPVHPRIAPAAAEAMMVQLASSLAVLPVSAALQHTAIQRCARRGLTGGAVHDALHLAAAEAGRTDGIVTFNARHFERLRDPDSPPVIVPGAWKAE